MLSFIKRPRDFWTGVMFIATGGLFASIALTYKLGTAARMGPGFFPFFLGAILAAIGVWTIVISIGAKERGSAVDKFHWSPLFWVLGSICVFGILLKITGMILAGIILVLGSSVGSGEFKFKEILILAIGLSIFCAAVFVGGLKLPIPMCPGFELFDQFSVCRV